MKPGLVLGVVVAVSAAIGLAPAQNLGLGTGSRGYPAEDSTALDDRSDDSEAPRRTQINRRLGLTARRGKDFDPREFEARGRELQNQFYEIGTATDPKQIGSTQPSPGGLSLGGRKDGSRQWLFWVGLAGATGASAGVLGYFLMNKAHPPTSPEKKLILTDDPKPL
jgi:hypothetical protein